MNGLRLKRPMSRSFGFPPVARADARVLVLGSLPGQASLAASQYYAQPQNAFWRIMGALFEAGPEHAYDERLRRLVEARVALWDVCASAARPGSLDHRIDKRSVAANDFAGFFAAHRQVAAIFFNGATAERLYLTLARPTLPPDAADIVTRRLPSTSPAHAGVSFLQKLDAWKEVAEAVRR
jgi:TDG/mug DNA glycosylase family protein